MAVAPQPHRPWRARLLAVGLGVLAGLGASELAFRALLFSGSETLARLGAGLRDPHHYGHAMRDDLYWILSHRWVTRSPDVAPGAHPRYGWVSGRFDPDGLEHRLEQALRGRRPILLFGDSFTLCLTEPDDCFQGLVAELPLGREAVVLNYGVGGFGFDQVHLLATDVLARWDALLAADPERPAPVVAIAIYIEGDVDRMALGFRSHVKPQYRLEGDALTLQAPEFLSTAAVVAERGLGVASWLVRYAIHSTRLGNRVREAEAERHRSDLETLTARVVGDAVARLEERGLEHFFVLLPGQPALRQASWGWQEPMLEQVLRESGARYVNARVDFAADRSSHGREPSDYFGSVEGPLAGHYNRLGNCVALLTLLRGLAGADDGGGALAAPLLGDAAVRSFGLRRRGNAEPQPTLGIDR